MEQKHFEALLSDAEVRLRRLKMLYEQWFAGFERTEPAVARKEIDDILQRLKREQIRNTGLRFRLHQLQQRHTTFITYWRRIARQIEEGTYQRDVLRAKKLRDQALREGAEPEISYGTDVDVQLDADMDAALEDVMREAEAAVEQRVEQRSAERSVVSFKPAQAAAPVASTAPAAPAPPAAALPGASLTPGAPGVKKPPAVPPRPPAGPRSISPFALPLPAGQAGMVSKAPPPPSAATATAARAAGPAAAPTAGGNGGLSSDDMKRIYDRYVAARKQNSERVDNVKLETIEKSLRGILPSFEKKHAGKKIDFEVVVKDGKVALKPVAK